MLFHPEAQLLLCFEEYDAVVKKVVDRVEKAMKILAAKKMDLNGKRKRNDGNDSDSSLGSEMRSLMAAVDREYEEGGRISRPSQRPRTRSRAESSG